MHSTNKWAIIATWKMSYNGVVKASKLLKNGASSKEAILTAIKEVENDARFHSVGFSGLPNADGVLQMDAGYMDGKTLSFGAVGALEDIANPIEVACSLKNDRFNNFLVGNGAKKYALDNNFEEKEMLDKNAKLYYETRKIKNKQLKPYREHDTVCVICLDNEGDLVVGTSTSGLFLKHDGRIGDAPIIGCGYYADNNLGASACTGVGEDIMKGVLSYDVLMRMKYGSPIDLACENSVAEFSKRLSAKSGSVNAMSLIALDPDGNFGVGTNVKFAFVYASNECLPAIYVADVKGSDVCIRLWNENDDDID